ncbi:MAG: thermonuclease family protein, partial [Actinobacteria bacterium]|nr:thermonuclease family protein [Actinomycetota bacterium]
DGDGLLDKDGTDGLLVSIRTDPSQDRRDRFGRLLAYVFESHNGVDLGEQQIKLGWGRRFVFDKRFSRYRRYGRAQTRARVARRSAWGRCGGDFHREK